MRLRSLATAAAHSLSLAVFVALAVAISWPLAASLDRVIPGEPGDNLAFLWNSWWMREALASPSTGFFHTDHLFAPFGIDLTLHTHTALPAWVAATVLGRLPVVTAQNVVVLGSLALNGFFAYLLAWDRLRVWSAALVAGVAFGAGSYLTTHLLGHYNLICAWGIPLFLLFLLRTLERGSRGSAAALGIAFALTAYCDYYYAVYEVMLAAGFIFATGFEYQVRLRPARAGKVSAVLLALFALALALAVVIVWSGGFRFSVAGVAVSATRPTNLLAAGWVLIALMLLVRLRPTLRVRASTGVIAGHCRALLPSAAVALVALTPLLINAWALWRRGDYIAPPFSWRGSPAGVDVATLLLGNPSNRWMGVRVRSLYQQLGIDRMESSAWIGLLPLAAVVWAAARWRSPAPAAPVTGREVRIWTLVAAAAFVWALGPWLHIGGFTAGLLLPQKFASLLPIVSNARIPGRAMAVVTLAAALLLALFLAQVRRERRVPFAAAALLVVLADSWSAPFPQAVIEVPALYTQLRDLPPGAVCELPTGMRDGLSRRGQLDERVMTYQMVHRHPIVGGFAARIPISIVNAYAAFPVLRSLMALSEGGHADSRDLAFTPEAVATALEQATVRYIVLDRATAAAPLVEFVERSLPLRLIGREGSRELYAVKTGGGL